MSQHEENDSESHVRTLHADLLRAWNRRDAQGFGRLFAADSLMIGFDGSQVAGAEIVDHLAPIFASHPTAEYVWEVRSLRAVGDNAMLLHAIVGMIPPGQDSVNPAVNAVQTLLAERRGESWRIVLFHNTPAQHHGRPELVEAHTAELQRLVNR